MRMTVSAVGTADISGSNATGEDGQRTKRKGNAIYAGNFNQSRTVDHAIDDKRNRARKQAAKLISDAWARDERTAQGIRDMQDEKAGKIVERSELQGIIADLEEDKENLRKEYGIDADSREQKDLELLEKYQDNKSGAAYDSFSEEEKERLRELADTPLTEYQKKVLEVNGAQGEVDINVQKKEYEIIALTQSVSNAKLDQLKSQDMQKSQDAADEVLAAAEKDIMGMLLQEGKDHIDEAAEEQKEKAEKAEEEKEEQQERIDEAKEKKEEQEKLIEGDLKTERLAQDLSAQTQETDHLSEAQKQVQKILQNNNMINEDLKGIEIDLNF